ncbi:MAG TPA: DUF2254 domain-containing protein [Solirubrobacterales bacterium]
MTEGRVRVAARERVTGITDSLKTTFGFPAALAMFVGLVAGFGLPSVDEWLDVSIPLFVFSTQDAARGMLETIATVTVAVAGISFSVTVVAFTLSANQLSPLVLRSFRRDRISQLTLAAFLGTFIYSLAVMVRLGALGPDRVPNLSISVAALLALLSFGLFAWFIAHITSMLQPSSIIASIIDDARSDEGAPYPAGVGAGPDETSTTATILVDGPGAPVRSESEGFLTVVRGEEVIRLAQQRDGIVRQRARIGDYVLPGEELAEAWTSSGREASELADVLQSCFELGRQRTLPMDPGFPVRQLADVALKGLSPGVNDPTTAQNAMDAMAALLIRFAGFGAPSRVRTDESGSPRLLAEAPDLDDLVRLGFEQVRVFAASDPAFLVRLLDLLAQLREVAKGRGLPHNEIDRQASLIVDTAAAELRPADLVTVREAYVRLHGQRR